MPTSLHFRDYKAILFTSLSHVRSVIASTGLYLFLYLYLFTLGRNFITKTLLIRHCGSSFAFPPLHFYFIFFPAFSRFFLPEFLFPSLPVYPAKSLRYVAQS